MNTYRITLKTDDFGVQTLILTADSVEQAEELALQHNPTAYIEAVFKYPNNGEKVWYAGQNCVVVGIQTPRFYVKTRTAVVETRIENLDAYKPMQELASLVQNSEIVQDEQYVTVDKTYLEALLNECQRF